MDFVRMTGKMFIIVGVLIAVVGFLLYFGAKLPFRLGQLPGDIVVRGRNSAFYFPIVTCLLLSAAITLISWLLTIMRK